MLTIKPLNQSFFQVEIIKSEEQAFYTSLRTIHSMPVKKFNSQVKGWELPVYDLRDFVKKCRTRNIPFKIQSKKQLIGIHNDLFKKRNKLLKIKKQEVAFKKIKAKMDVLKHPLFDFQTIGSWYAYKASSCLIVDMVGLGKTIQSLAATEKSLLTGKCNFILVICPSTLKGNWESEIETFTNDRKCISIGGHKSYRKQLYKESYFYDYMIVNYDLLYRDIELIKKYVIERPSCKMQVIIDEIQYIKNKNAKRTRSTKEIALSENNHKTIGLSATILETSVTDLFSAFHIVDNYIFGDNTQFGNFIRNFCRTDFFGTIVGYKNEKLLKARMKPYYIRRFKEHVLDQLPKRIENNYFVELSPLQRKFYDDMAKRIVDEIDDEEKAARIKNANVLAMLTYLRQASISAKLVGHKKNISTKTDKLIDFIESIDKQHNKIVIFSHFTEMVEILYDVLNGMKIKTMGMHGKSHKRLGCPVVDRIPKTKKWDNDPTYKVLVTSDILREGVNILKANYLVNLDILFNPAKMEQRTGRLDRIGNKHSCINIVNIVAKDTVEETVAFRNFSNNRQMSEDIIDDGKTENRSKRFKIKDLKGLLNNN